MNEAYRQGSETSARQPATNINYEKSMDAMHPTLNGMCIDPTHYRCCIHIYSAGNILPNTMQRFAGNPFPFASMTLPQIGAEMQNRMFVSRA